MNTLSHWIILGCLRTNQTSQETMNPPNPNITQIYLLSVHLYPVLGLPEGSPPIYSIFVASMNPNATFWVELALQGQALVMSAFMENREVMFIIHTPELLVHLASKGMRHGMELYNSHLWMSMVLQAPLNFSIPTLPIFHIPTWETSTVQQPTMNLVSPLYFTTYQNFMDINPLYHHWQMQGSMGEVPMPTQMIPLGLLDNASIQVPNNVASSSQVPPNNNLTHPRPVNTLTQKIEEALKMMREIRTEITILKDIKVMVFNDKYAKKFILICPQNLIKTSIDIRR